MSHRLVLSTLALGLLLTGAVLAQHQHSPSGASPAGPIDTKGYDTGPGGGDPQPPANCAGVTAKITIVGMTFTPSTVTITAGQPVCWTWTGAPYSHNVKADDDSFTSGAPANNGNFQHTFATPGSFGFHCQVHGSVGGGMHGTIVVLDPAGGGGDPPPPGPGTIGLNPGSYDVTEGAAPTMTVTVERANGSVGAASVTYATVPGTAKPGKDYLPRGGVLRWANGDGAPKTIPIAIKNDKLPGLNRSFTVRLSKATGASLGTATATVTIHDDDNPPCTPAPTNASKLLAIGQSASEVRLTWTPGSGPSHIERRPPGGVFGEIGAVPAGAGVFTDAGLVAGVTFEYRIRTDGVNGGAAYSAIAAGATDGGMGACDERNDLGHNALCLNGGRFEATVDWNPMPADNGRESKRVMLPDAPNSGLFALAPHDDLQVLVNVLDRCDVNGHYWLDLASVTDVGFTLKVRDTQTGRTRVYYNPAGTTPATVRDVEAFATCP
jgi:plastocyanin